jgi:hypothetical protein
MKNLFFLLAICTGLVFFSCNKDDDESTPENFITATIDGNAFAATTIYAIADDTFGEELVLISGANSDASFTIGLNIPTSTPINTSIAIDETDFGINFTDTDENAFFTVGEIELSTNNTDNNLLEGIFSFTATDDSDSTNIHTVTSGNFRITY